MKNTDEFHLTLQFLGDDVPSAELVIEALKTVRFEPFKIEMGDAIPFGPPHNLRGVWIECAKNPALEKLAADIRKAMEPLGLIPDKPFAAHITLGRYKKQPHESIVRIKGEPHRFAVEHFYLMESTLSSAGPLHKQIAEF